VTRRSGVFIVLEGPDKSGKSTQARRLSSALLSRGVRATRTREPGGTGVAEGIRKVLLDPKLSVSPRAELFLYEASRAQHTDEVIRPALERGEVVVCERYTMSTDVYQGIARGLGTKTTAALNATATNGLEADLTIVITIPGTEFSQRDQKRKLDRLERESTAFHDKVRTAYVFLAKKRKRTILIDGTRPEDEIHADILSRVTKLLK
jgi:dTMP kinase